MDMRKRKQGTVIKEFQWNKEFHKKSSFVVLLFMPQRVYIATLQNFVNVEILPIQPDIMKHLQQISHLFADWGGGGDANIRSI